MKERANEGSGEETREATGTELRVGLRKVCLENGEKQGRCPKRVMGCA